MNFIEHQKRSEMKLGTEKSKLEFLRFFCFRFLFSKSRMKRRFVIKFLLDRKASSQRARM